MSVHLNTHESKSLLTTEQRNLSTDVTSAAIAIIASAAIAAGVIALLQLYQVTHFTFSPLNSFSNMGVIGASACVGAGAAVLIVNCLLTALLIKRHVGKKETFEKPWDPSLKEVAVEDIVISKTSLLADDQCITTTSLEIKSLSKKDFHLELNAYNKQTPLLKFGNFFYSQDLVKFASWRLDEGQCWIHQFLPSPYCMVISKTQNVLKVAYFNTPLAITPYLLNAELKDVSSSWYAPNTPYQLSESELDWINWHTDNLYATIDISTMPDDVCYEYDHVLFSIFYKKWLNNNQPIIVTKPDQIAKFRERLKPEPYSMEYETLLENPSPFFRNLDTSLMEQHTYYVSEVKTYFIFYCERDNPYVVPKTKYHMEIKSLTAEGFRRIEPPKEA